MDPAESPPPPPHLGQMLAAERERQGLSRVDVAQRLHMSPWQIEALEGNDFARLPQGTFLRGFVRNYARVLGMDAGLALESLAQSVPTAPVPGIVVPTQNIRFDPLGQRFASPWFRAWSVAGVAFLLALAATYWWIFVRPAPLAAASREAPSAPVARNIAPAPLRAPEPVTLAEAPKEAAPPGAAPKVEPSPATKVEPSPATKVEPPPPPAPVSSAPKTAAPASEAPRPATPPDLVTGIVPVQATQTVPGARTVRLRFKGSSWVEIKDRSGRVLLSKLNEPGSEAEVSGRPPLSVVVGNAPLVTVTYDDREVPLEPHTRVAVARFTLE